MQSVYQSMVCCETMSETRAAVDDPEQVGKRFFKRIEKESKETAEKVAKLRARNIGVGLLLTTGVMSICEHLFRHAVVPVVLICSCLFQTSTLCMPLNRRSFWRNWTKKSCNNNKGGRISTTTSHLQLN